VFEVSGAELVTPLGFKPAVMTGAPGGATGWLDVSVDWFGDQSRRDVPLAASGPKDWPRVAVQRQRSTNNQAGSRVALGATPLQTVTPAKVRNIHQGDESLSFDVDTPGSPVLVKMSYFPNWKASGAKGPYRVTPNLMVVVPTSRHVTLHYRSTPVDVGGWLLTIAGIGLAVLVTRRGPVHFDDEPEGSARPPVEPGITPVEQPELDFAPVTARASPPVGVPDRGS
jgi:hypothetical protein